MKIKIIYSIISVILFTACNNDDELSESKNFLNHPQNVCVKITTSRKTYNLQAEDSDIFHHQIMNLPGTRSSETRVAVEKEYQCSDMLILPQCQSKIWLGNVITRNSAMNSTFKPIDGFKKTIDVSTTLPGTVPESINAPSYSRYNSFIQSQEKQGSFEQNQELSISEEQFTSYNELKRAFGSNVNTNVLFWGSSKSSSYEEHKIQKSTGIYVKFYQKSFTASMDISNPPYAMVEQNMMDSALYINSITYGHMGILALETNSNADYAKTTITSSFHKLFSHGSSSFSKEEKEFLDGCSFREIVIGGNSSSAVQCFTGYDGFISHIANSTFSSNEPGVPIFCTFANVSDNSLAYMNFKYTIFKDPLYIDIIDTKNGQFEHQYAINFYSDRNRTPTIADPLIKFNFKKDIKFEEQNKMFRDTTFIESFYNYNYDKSIKACGFVTQKSLCRMHGGYHGQMESDEINIKYENETLLSSPDYELLSITDSKNIDNSSKPVFGGSRTGTPIHKDSTNVSNNNGNGKGIFGGHR